MTKTEESAFEIESKWVLAKLLKATTQNTTAPITGIYLNFFPVSEE